MKNIITIDGFASSGKSTIARHLSQKIKWPWFSSGVLYRGLAFVQDKEKLNIQKCIDFIETDQWEAKISQQRTLFYYQGQDVTDNLYTEKIDELSSHISADQAIREKLAFVQQSVLTENPEGLIMEGRDIGTIIFPDASLKIFLEAPDKIRAKRRAEQRQGDGKDILESQKQRDERDKNRPFAPVKKPENCLVFNSEKQGIDEIVENLYQQAQKTFKNL